MIEAGLNLHEAIEFLAIYHHNTKYSIELESYEKESDDGTITKKYILKLTKNNDRSGI